MKRPYETVVVFDGTQSDESLHKEQVKIEDLLKQSTSFEKVDVWGKRSLAYPIRKKRLGFYCLFLYESEGGAINSLERQLKLNELVLRYLTVVRDVKNDASRAAFFARREKAIEEASAAAKAAEGSPAAATAAVEKPA
ncbi:MAG: 30S ribosomal protein S6 [Chitinispirillaceae bacterium]|nr:30S ribosomal protein S6 [Chitinispirillaceae bacterium]